MGQVGHEGEATRDGRGEVWWGKVGLARELYGEVVVTVVMRQVMG